MSKASLCYIWKRCLKKSKSIPAFLAHLLSFLPLLSIPVLPRAPPRLNPGESLSTSDWSLSLEPAASLLEPSITLAFSLKPHSSEKVRQLEDC